MISERLQKAALSAHKLTTPFYLFDFPAIEQATKLVIHEWSEQFPKFTVAYSYKTNAISGIAQLLRTCGTAAEVVSGLELAAALADGFNADQVFFDGPVKHRWELLAAIEAGVSIQIDSLMEVRELADCVALLDIEPRICLRLAVPRGRRKWSRFGLMPDEVVQARRMLAGIGAPVRGVHFNIGSQPLNADPYRAVLREWRELLKELSSQAKEPLVLDIGGGFPSANCAPGHKLPSSSIFAEGVATECRDIGLPVEEIHLVIEPGRSLVEDHAILVTSVAVRKSRTDRDIVVLDGGTNLVRTINAWHHPIKFGRNGNILYDVYGSMCYESDSFAERLPGPADIHQGDYVLIGSAGAYDIPSANVWMRPHPPVYSIPIVGEDLECIREVGANIR